MLNLNSKYEIPLIIKIRASQIKNFYWPSPRKQMDLTHKILYKFDINLKFLLIIYPNKFIILYLPKLLQQILFLPF